jgi:hypothetical protein
MQAGRVKTELNGATFSLCIKINIFRNGHSDEWKNHHLRGSQLPCREGRGKCSNKNSQLYNHVHSEKAVPMLKEVSILYSYFSYVLVLAINYSSDTAPIRQTGRPSWKDRKRSRRRG